MPDFKISDDLANNPTTTFNGSEVIPLIAGPGSPDNFLNSAAEVTDLAEYVVEDYPPVKLGYRTIPLRSFVTDDTPLTTDGGKGVLHPTSDANGRTVSIDSSQFPIFSVLTIVNQDSAGDVTITNTATMRLAGSGSTGVRLLTDNGIATVIKITSSEWLISGVNLS